MMSPDFIGIGGHKCASTWLWYVLNQHPGVWVPHRKELHYFDRSEQYPSPNELDTPLLKERLLSGAANCRAWRRLAFHDLAAALVKRDWARLRWALRFYSGEYQDEWYLNLFDQPEGIVTGEITPAYTMLTEEDFRQMHQLMPAVKIILLLRDPVERAWSHIRFDAGTGRLTDINDWQEVKAYIDGPTLTRRGDYVTTLNALEAVFPSEQLFIGFYDQIKHEPEKLLQPLSEFLGIDESGFPVQHTSRKIGGSQVKSMPEHIQTYLAEKYIGPLRELEGRLGAPVTQWRENAEQILQSS